MKSYMAYNGDPDALRRRTEVSSIATVTATTPWKQLLLRALESNSHLKHSSFFQFVHLKHFMSYRCLYNNMLHLLWSVNFVVLVVFLGTNNSWIWWETFQSHCSFQVLCFQEWECVSVWNLLVNDRFIDGFTEELWRPAIRSKST